MNLSRTRLTQSDRERLEKIFEQPMPFRGLSGHLSVWLCQEHRGASSFVQNPCTTTCRTLCLSYQITEV